MTTKVKINTNAFNTSLDEMGGHRCLVKAPNGTLWVVYPTDEAVDIADLLVAYSSNGGVTWTEETALADGLIGFVQFQTYGKGLVLLIDSSNVPHIIFLGELVANSNLRVIKHLKRTGGAWGAVETIDTCDALTNIGFLSAAIDSTDNIHIVASGTFGGTYSPYYWTGTYGSWSARESINAGGGDVDVCVDSGNKPHCIYYSSGYKYRNRITGSWNVEETITSVNALSGKIVTDSGNNIHVVWNENFGAQNSTGVKYRKRTSGVWGTEQIVIIDEALGNNYAYPLLSADSSDNIYVIYQLRFGGASLTVWYKAIINEIVGGAIVVDANLTAGSYSSIFTSLWHRFPSSGVLSPTVSPMVVLIDGTPIDLYFEYNPISGEQQGVIAVVGETLHYASQRGFENVIQGIGTGASDSSGESNGAIAVVDDQFHYVSKTGFEYVSQGSVAGAGDGTAGESLGTLAVVGETLHYVGKSGVEYVYQGTAV